MKTLLLASTACFIATANFAENLVDLDSPEFGEAVRAYIMDNPQIVFEAADKFQTAQAEIANAEAEAKLTDLEPQLQDETQAIVIGNPDAAITIVEVIDYACGYCRKAHSVVNALAEKNQDVKFVVRQFPILGQGSFEASQVALAILNTAGNEKATEFHNAVYEGDAQINFDGALSIAESIGLDRAEIEEASKSPDILAEVAATNQAARELNINGTPGFIMNGQIFPGYIPEEDFQKLIDQARAQTQ